jgi:hypothetical protein
MTEEVDPLAQLEAGLREAIKHRGTNDRKASVDALEAVLDFLYAQPNLTAAAPGAVALPRPLFELCVALKDLDLGQVAPILQKSKVDHRAKRSTVRREARGHVLFAVEQLMDKGDKADPACQRVFPICRRHFPDVASWRTIRGWYDEQPTLPPGDPEREVIAASRSYVRSIDPDNSRTKAHVLASLDNILRAVKA